MQSDSPPSAVLDRSLESSRGEIRPGAATYRYRLDVIERFERGELDYGERAA
jgi:hypothetical protein